MAEPTGKMKPAVSYIRRSTDRQEQSIGDQRREIERFAREHGFHVVCEYIDDAVRRENAYVGVSIEGNETSQMAADDATRALALLARWAIRRAQKRRPGAEEEISKVVNGGFSKGSGSQETAQLTCYGPTKR